MDEQETYNGETTGKYNSTLLIGVSFPTKTEREEPLVVVPGQLALWLELSAFIAIDILGLVGNVLLITIIIFGKNMKTSANYFIVNLGIADLLVCAWITPNVIVTRWHRHWTMGNAICLIQAFVNHATLCAAIFNLAAVAVNRLVATRYIHKYNMLFSPKLSTVYIAATWFLALLFAAFPFMGWGQYAYDDKKLNCIFSRKSAPSFSLFFSISCIYLPLTTATVCYILIWMTYMKSRRTVNLLGRTVVTSTSFLSERKLTKNLLIVILTFCICFLPMIVLLFSDPEGKSNSGVHAFALWMMLCNSCVNPVIYGTRKKIRAEFFRLASRIKFSSSNRQRDIQVQIVSPL